MEDDILQIEERLDQMESYLNAEVHVRCDYDIYSSLMDMLSGIQADVNELREDS